MALDIESKEFCDSEYEKLEKHGVCVQVLQKTGTESESESESQGKGENYPDFGLLHSRRHGVSPNLLPEESPKSR